MEETKDGEIDEMYDSRLELAEVILAEIQEKKNLVYQQIGADQEAALRQEESKQ